MTLDWKQLYEKGMKALIEGDDSEAVTVWRQSVALVEREKLSPTVEMSRLYYGLGKTLNPAANSVEESISLLTTAEKIAVQAKADGSTLSQIRYDLGTLLSKANRSGDATGLMQLAMGISSEPLAKCLAGGRKDDLEIKPTVKALQKQGLAKELTPAVFKTLAKLLVESGRADEGEDESIHPFDLFYEYYESAERAKADSCAPWESDPSFDFETKTEQIHENMLRLNALLGEELIQEADVKVVTVEPWSATSGDKLYCVAIDDARVEGVPVHEVSTGMIAVYNMKLSRRKDVRRLVRFASYDDREMVIVMPLGTAVKLYKAGAGHLFENLSHDLEPEMFADKMVSFQ